MYRTKNTNTFCAFTLKKYGTVGFVDRRVLTRELENEVLLELTGGAVVVGQCTSALTAFSRARLNSLHRQLAI